MLAPKNYIYPIEVDLAARDAIGAVDFQVPDGGFRILRFVPTGWDNAGAPATASLIVPPQYDQTSDNIKVSIYCEQAMLKITEGAVSFWTLTSIHESPLWMGQWVDGRTKLKFEFSVSSDLTRLTFPITIGFDLWGLIGGELETLDFSRYGGYRNLTGSPLLSRFSGQV